MKIKHLAIDAMLAAMCAALGYFSVDLGNMKFTFESFPVILGALLLGPVDGMLIALVGTGIYQILKWGLMSTTPLWVFPYVILALFIGLLYKKSFDRKRFFALIIGGGVLLTLLNTVGIYIDSKIWDYYSFAYVFGSFFIRIVTSVLKSVLFAFVLPTVIDAVKGVAR